MPNDQSVQRFNQRDLHPSFFSNDAFLDQSFYKFPRAGIYDSATLFEFNRAITLPNVPFVAKGGSVPLSETEVSLTQLSFTRIAATPKIDVWDQASSRGVDQMAQQIDAVKRAIQRQLSFSIVQGVAPSFSGLETLSFQTSVNNPVTGALTLQDIYRAKNLMRGTGGPSRFGGPGVGSCAMIMHEKTQRELFGLLDQAGLRVDWVLDHQVGAKVAEVFGMSTFINNSITLNQGATLDRTSIYFLSFDSSSAVKLIYCKDEQHECDQDGIQSYLLPVKEGTNELFAYVGGFYTLLVPEAQSAVRLSNIKPTFFAQ